MLCMYDEMLMKIKSTAVMIIKNKEFKHQLNEQQHTIKINPRS